MTLQTALQSSAAIVGYLTVLITGIAWAIKWGRGLSMKADKINYLIEQVKENGGSSLIDKINRIEFLILVEQASRRFFWSHQNNHPIFEANEHGDWVFANKALAQMFGMQISDLLGNGWMTAVNESQRKEVQEAWKYAMTEHTPYERTFDLINRNDGKQIRVTMGVSMCMLNGKPARYFGTIKPA